MAALSAEEMLAALPEVPTINLPTDLTSSQINEFIPQLKIDWQTGLQLATSDTIFSRRFKILGFEAETRIDQINLGYYSTVYQGDKYYRIVGKFTESNYSSQEDFLKWKRIRQEYSYSLIHKHAQTGQLEWERPEVPDSEPPEYIGTKYTLLIDNGFGLYGVFDCNSPHTLHVIDDEDEVPSLVNKVTTSEFLLTKRYIKIVITPSSSTQASTLTATFFGEYIFTEVNLGNVVDKLTLLHPSTSAFNSRLKPPGQSQVNDNFPTSEDFDALPIFDYGSRNTGPDLTTIPNSPSIL